MFTCSGKKKPVAETCFCRTGLNRFKPV